MGEAHAVQIIRYAEYEDHGSTLAPATQMEIQERHQLTVLFPIALGLHILFYTHVHVFWGPAVRCLYEVIEISEIPECCI